MNSIDQKYIAIPWGMTGLFLFLFYSTVYFPLNKSLHEAGRYVHKKQYNLAIFESSRIIADYPNHKSGHFIRAQAYTARHDWDRAIADYDQILQMGLNSPHAYLFRGNLYLRKGDYDHAILDYSQVLQGYFYNKSLYLPLSMAYFAKKDYMKSLEDLRRAQSLDVSIPPSYLKELKNAVKTQ